MFITAAINRKLVLPVALSLPLIAISAVTVAENSHADLLELFKDWRAFEEPPMLEGAPNYTKAYREQAHREFTELRDRLNAIDLGDWTIEDQVDWHIVRAEMNGYDFNHRVLRPWERDPAFYQTIWTHQSDVPGHEGPTHHAILELWTYEFPLSATERARIISDLQVIPPLMRQARTNLTGNAKDLWVAGIRNIRAQSERIDLIRSLAGAQVDGAMDKALSSAKAATLELLAWLEEQAESKTGPSGIGEQNYSWYQMNVHYNPMTFEEEKMLLQRELDRSWASLKLEEHRNRDLPELTAAATLENYNQRVEHAITQMMSFFDEQQVMPVEAYMEDELRKHTGAFVPAEKRSFFAIVSHHDPRPLMSHYYHWFDLAKMREDPHESLVRRNALLYNIFDTRNEGTATGVEEMFMHAGLYEDKPRARELVWIMLAQRAARGLGSLYAHANDMDMAEASTVHIDWTPRGWMTNEPELVKFEQHLYMRQPGYGTSYVTGKYLLERLLAARTKQKEAAGESYSLSEFFGELSDAGSVPIALVTWQLTGDDRDIQKIMNYQSP